MLRNLTFPIQNSKRKQNHLTGLQEHLQLIFSALPHLCSAFSLILFLVVFLFEAAGTEARAGSS